MKVVLFCGGLGLRLREYPENVPKPMAPIGPRPVLWHVMRSYAHFGHRDFLLCLGYRAGVIKDYFLHYDETASNDFVLSDGGRSIELLNTDIEGWRITFADTGLNASIGQRLRAVRDRVAGDGMFLASYGDCLTDAPIDELIEDFRGRDEVAAFLAVRPSQTFHVVKLAEGGRVESIGHVRDADIWINGGFFIFRDAIFDHIGEDEDLVEAPFRRLIAAGQLVGYRHDGFWATMDTHKEMQELNGLYDTGLPPWAIWRGASR